MKFSELCEQHKRNNRLARYSENTILRHQQAQKLFLRFLGEDKDAEAITATNLEDFILTLLNQNLKPTTINTHIRSIKALFTWASNKHEPALITCNNFLRVKQLKQDEVIPDFFTPEELIKLIQASEQESTPLLFVRNRAIMLTLYDTGLRATELCNLRVEHFRDNTAKCSWREGLEPDDMLWQPAGVLKVVAGKGRKQREVPLSPETVKAINNWRKELEEKPHGRGNRMVPNDHPGSIPWLFCSNTFEQLSRDSLKTMCYKLGKRVGLDCHPHKIRHSFAMFYINSNPSERGSLQSILGHSSPRMTEHYARLLSKATSRSHAKNSPVARLTKDEQSRQEALNMLTT